MPHAEVYGHCLPISFQFGERDIVYKVDRPTALVMDQPGNLDIVIGEADSVRQVDFKIQKLLAVDVLRDTEARRFCSRVPLDGVLLEGDG